MGLHSDSLPDLVANVPDLCPTSARPRASRHAGLPDLPTFSAARVYTAIHSTVPTHVFIQKRSGRLGRSGKWRNGAVLVCPTSAQPLGWSGRARRAAPSPVAAAGREAQPHRRGLNANLNGGSSWEASVAGNSDPDLSLVNRRELRLIGQGGGEVAGVHR